VRLNIGEMNKVARTRGGNGDKGRDKHKTFGVDTQALPVVDQALVITRNAINNYEAR
jgi:hypothetical protein